MPILPNNANSTTKISPAPAPATTSVVILSAGHGTRMLPLTKNTPKPLLKVGDRSLIEHHLTRLKESGFNDVVINIAYLGDKIQQKLGNGSNYGLSIKYSDEADTGALETAGGIKAALPLIKSNPFLVINADIWTDFDFTRLLSPLKNKARLIMVNNPEHNPKGDFHVSKTGVLTNMEHDRYTFTGIAMYKKSVFENIEPGKQALAPVLRSLITNNDVDGLIYQGLWKDIGTPERLKEINQLYSANED